MTTTHKTYSFYCDESGTFRTIDTHVICPLIIEDEAVGNENMGEIWKKSFPEGNWERFHATDMDKTIVQNVLDRMVLELFNVKNVSAAYIFHQNTLDYNYDFYYGLLYKFFLWFFTVILDSENTKRTIGDRVIVKFNIYLAERGPMNLMTFQKSLQSRFSKMVSEFNKRHHIPTDNFGFNIAIYTLPASQSPFIQVSDLLSYIIRAYLKGGQMSSDSTTFLKNLKNTEALEIELNTDEFKTLSRKSRSDQVFTMVIKNIESTPKQTPSPVVRVEESFSQVFLNSLPNLTRESKTGLVMSLNTHVGKMMQHDRMQQMIETDHIRFVAETMIKKTREFLEGSILIQFLQQYIDGARVAENPLSPYLDKLEVQTAVQYLAVNNHQGHFPLNDECVRKAKTTADKLKLDIACWPMVCDFYNNMSVSLHNIFDFSQATQRLHSLIEHLERDLKNPFRGSGIKCYEIGALFGSYAQTLAFDAHCTFFRTQDTMNLQRMLEESEYYSDLAKEHFAEPVDHERQITYQTHFNLQADILTGEKKYLDVADRLLASDGKTEEAIDTFIKTCPERSMMNPAYWVSVALKTAYLSGQKHPKTAAIIEVILKNRDILPPYHPIEQILAYLTLMAEQSDQAKRLRELLGHLNFPPNIVKTIQLIMQLQVAYHLKQPITLLKIQEIANSLTPDIEPQWRNYGLIQVLQEYIKSPNRWHVGPMEVLPFNYC